MQNLTQERLKELLSYNPETGIFTWKSGRKRIAGCKESKGYWVIIVDNKKYFAHRLVFLYCEGYFPENGIDHINRIKTDNRIINLREASNQCNMRNSKLREDNSSGVKGVYFSKDREKWCATIRLNKKERSLGRFDDFSEAICHRLAAEQCLDWSGCDSNSPAFQYVKNNINGDAK